MTFLLLATGMLVASGLLALAVPGGDPVRPARLAAAGAVSASLLGLIPAVAALLGANSDEIAFSWGVFGTLRLGIDALSGLFLVPILILSPLAAVYGVGYLSAHGQRRKLAAGGCLFNLLVASMVLVVAARDALSFLVAWEVMALTSFFLVAYESERESVREAAWVYLVASHIGTAFIFAFFVVLAGSGAGLDFEALHAGAARLGAGGPLFLLALLGFGAKAGFLPLHVWLPEAHPAAPSHISALMSGVMIKTGIYGILRALLLLGPPPAWWGWTLVAIGLSSGILGVLFALAQHDLKRLLAYHSVENIGIIALGIGLGLVGIAEHLPALAVLGLAGGLLHVVNHALFKGLLFFGAGAVLHAAGTREIDHLGGLAKRMPWTAASFLTGAVAISGLPPLNGFISELLIYLGAFGACVSKLHGAALPALAALAGLALIGALATACFTKAFGAVFLGEMRSAHGVHAHDPGVTMRVPMAALALLCVLVGLSAPLLIGGLGPALAQFPGMPVEQVRTTLAEAAGTLSRIVLAAAIFAAGVGALAWLRRRLLAGRPVTAAPTWDCGYARSAASMQYTASSFADPIVRLFQPFLRTHRSAQPAAGFFPRSAAIATETPDPFIERLFTPLFNACATALATFRWLQHGGVHLYVLYVALTLVLLLVGTLV